MKYFIFFLVILSGCQSSAPPSTVDSVPQTKLTAPAVTKTAKPLVTADIATPVGVVVQMTDGTTQTVPLGVWITFASGSGCSPSCPSGRQLRGIFPTQYVNQIATVQPDSTWKYNRPGRNLQVWRNGVLQRLATGTPLSGDYTVSATTMIITPLPVILTDGSVISMWNPDDYVTVAYIY